MALHPQQSAEADNRSDILHQLTILSSALTHQPLPTSLLARSARWPALREQFRGPQVLPVRFWLLHRHQTSMLQQMLLLFAQKVINNSYFPLLITMHPLLTILFGILIYSCRKYRRGRHLRNRCPNIPNSLGISPVHPPFSSIHLTSVFSNQIQCLPSKTARTTASPVQVT